MHGSGDLELRLHGEQADGKEDGGYYWVAVKELKLSYHNGYIYIYSK